MLILEVRILRDGTVLTHEQITMRQGKVGIQCTFHPDQWILDNTEHGTLVLQEYEVTYETKFLPAEVVGEST